METNDINIKILCQNIANNPKDFDALTLEIWFNRFAEQRFNEETVDEVIVNGIGKATKLIPGVSNNEERVAVCSHPKQYRRVDIDGFERCDLCNQITN